MPEALAPWQRQSPGSVPFRLAIVGCGQVGAHEHLPAALSSRRISVEALVDTDLDRARALAQGYGLRARVTSRLEDVLPSVEGAVVATPNHAHLDVALRCLRAGVAVLVEKPLATTAADGEAIVSAAEAAGRVVAAGYTTRFRDNVRLVGELLREQRFGAVRRFAYQFGTVGGWAPVSGYNLDRKATGGGVLMVTGTHFLDRMFLWFGAPDSFEYRDDSLGGPEANCVATFRFRRGERAFDGVIRLSKTVALRRGVAIETDEGIVAVGESDDAPVVLRPRDAPDVEHLVRHRRSPVGPPAGSIFLAQLEDFVDACRESRPPATTGRDGVASLRLIEAMYERREPLGDDWYDPAEAGA